MSQTTWSLVRGGDFNEFGLAVLQELAPDGKSAAGCLWPIRGIDPKALFFEQEYFESEARHAPWAVVAISVANDYSLIQPLIRRVRELLPDASLIVVAACATEEVHEQLRLQGVGMLAGVRRKIKDINYWDLVERLDRRELKIIPRMTYWLVDRMEARAALREEYTLAQKASKVRGTDVERTDEGPSADEAQNVDLH